MIDKLDIENHLKSFSSFFAREKGFGLEGDYYLHFDFIKEIEKYQLKELPKVKNLDDELIRLKKYGILKSDSLNEFIKIINYFIYLKNYAFEEGKVKSFIDKIIVPEILIKYLDFFDDKAVLKSNANEELYAIREAIKHKKEAIKRKFHEALHLKDLSDYLVDRQLHSVEDGFALLVRGGFSKVIKAQIVDRSKVGFFYIIPSSVQKEHLGLKELKTKENEAIYKIEKEISTIFSKFISFLKFINKAYDRFDHYLARVLFAKANNLEIIKTTNSKKIILSNFIHPALHDPVAINVEFNKSILLITGVNAGGKTMMLKSILSAAYMSKYLIPFKCNVNKTKIGRFKQIEAIIEDPQNAKNDISTFAGRIKSFSQMLNSSNALIGVDEIELGTDSDEAAVLFKVVVEELIKRHNKIIITTHHKRLAALLSKNDEVELLAAIYDEKRQLPTFSFLKGSIGKSYAFETAFRYGISKHIINEAKKLYGEEKERLNDLVEKSINLELELNQKKAKLDKELEIIYQEKQKLKNLQDEAKDALQSERSRLEKEYFEAIKEAKNAINAKDTKTAHRLLNEANKKYKNIKKPKEIKTYTFKVGDYVKFSKTYGTILKIKNKEAILDCDGKKVTIAQNLLKPAIKTKTKPKTKLNIQKPKTADIKLDLHGLRAEEALEKIDKFINNSLLSGFEEVIIYHGIGSGILSRVTREYLKENPLVKSYEDAPPNMGGYGATIVKF